MLKIMSSQSTSDKVGHQLLYVTNQVWKYRLFPCYELAVSLQVLTTSENITKRLATEKACSWLSANITGNIMINTPCLSCMFLLSTQYVNQWHIIFHFIYSDSISIDISIFLSEHYYLYQVEIQYKCSLFSKKFNCSPRNTEFHYNINKLMNISTDQVYDFNAMVNGRFHEGCKAFSYLKRKHCNLSVCYLFFWVCINVIFGSLLYFPD